MGDVLAELEKEFCPPLESALVYAVFSDFDERQEDILSSVRKVLNPLKEDALAEQFSAFDPSGSRGRDGIQVQGTGADTPSEAEDSRTGSGASHSGNTDLSRASSGLASLQLDGTDELGGDGAFIEELNRMDAESKEARLRETFPILAPATVLFALRKNGFDFARATDELLNHVYFSEANGDDRVAAKSVDAFFDDRDDASPLGHPRRPRKKGKKLKNARLHNAGSDIDRSATSSPALSDAPARPSPQQQNRWDAASQDISFLSSRANVPRATASSFYHAAGGSLPAAIAAIAAATLEQGECLPLTDDGGSYSSMAWDAVAELVADFPQLDPGTALALLWIARPSTAHGHELAKALFSPPPSGSAVATQRDTAGGIEIVPQYAPIDASSPPSPPSPPLLPSLPAAQPSGSTPLLAVSRTQSLAAQTAAASRRARSDPLFRAVAGHYAAERRAAFEQLQAHQAAGADALVARQSREGQVDLHGVTVADAERIARREAERWWGSEEEVRAARRGRDGEGAEKGLVVVTGVGRHSEGGRAKIGPAVARMLVREGWRVEVAGGCVVVKGRTKR